MIYAGELGIQYPVKDLYDKALMQMSMAAAKDMYEKGQKRIDDFYKEYGDFISPIQKDMDWYNQNVTGKVRDTINNLYANGVDPLRSAEGRAAVAQLIYSMPVGDIAKLRQSAQNATAFNKAKMELQAQGLYNPLLEPYDGVSMSDYSTLGDDETEGMGVWNRMSPTPYQNMAKFSKDYFDNISPIVRSASKNGISYTIKEITEKDLHNIADQHFNDLVNTPQGQLMYKMYLDQTGGDPTAARQAFNNAVVSGNLDRLKYEDDYNDNYFKRQDLALKAQSNALAREKFNWEKQKYQLEQEGKGEQDLTGISLAQRWYDKATSNAWSADGITKHWKDMRTSYGQFGKQVDKVFYDFGQKQKGKSYNQILQAFENQFSFAMDSKSVAGAIGDTVSGNERVVQATLEDVNKLFGVDDVISNTAGFTRDYRNKDTNEIRSAIEKYGASNTTITPLGTGYGSLRKIGADFNVMPKVHVTVTDASGKVVLSKDAYYNLNLGSETTAGGAYISGYKENKGQGVRQIGKAGVHYDRELNSIVPNDVSYDLSTMRPSTGIREFNMYPNYNNWVGFGVWDTRETNKNLKAGQSEKLGSY